MIVREDVLVENVDLRTILCCECKSNQFEINHLYHRIMTAFSLREGSITSEKRWFSVSASINVVESRGFCFCWIALWIMLADLWAMKKNSLVLVYSNVGLLMMKSMSVSAIFFWVISKFLYALCSTV